MLYIDLSSNRQVVISFVEICNRLQLSPLHLQNEINDYRYALIPQNPNGEILLRFTFSIQGVIWGLQVNSFFVKLFPHSMVRKRVFRFEKILSKKIELFILLYMEYFEQFNLLYEQYFLHAYSCTLNTVKEDE